MQPFKCEVDETKLRTPVTNVMKTRGLFIEERTNSLKANDTKDFEASYTLQDREHKGYPSMYKIYMDCCTDYETGIRLLGSFRHWQKLSNSTWFRKKCLDVWEAERHLKEEAIAKATILEAAANGNVSAARAILDSKLRKGAGRPSKDEVTGHLNNAVASHNHLSSIVSRMKKENNA